MVVSHLILDRLLLLHGQPGRDDHADGEAGKSLGAGLADQLNWKGGNKAHVKTRS